MAQHPSLLSAKRMQCVLRISLSGRSVHFNLSRRMVDTSRNRGWRSGVHGWGRCRYFLVWLPPIGGTAINRRFLTLFYVIDTILRPADTDPLKVQEESTRRSTAHAVCPLPGDSDALQELFTMVNTCGYGRTILNYCLNFGAKRLVLYVTN